MTAIDKALNIDDLAALARRRLPKGLYEFVERGAEDEVTMRENAAAIKKVLIRQRVGVDTANGDLSTTLFGVKQSMPIGLSVTGMAGMLSYKGEQALARAAAKAGVPYMLGTANFAGLAEIKGICGDLVWRQLYPQRSDEVLERHLNITRDAGVRVLVITLDSPVPGNREYMRRSGFWPGTYNFRTVSDTLSAPRWLFGTVLRYQLNGGLPKLADMPEGQNDLFGRRNTGVDGQNTYTWETIRDIRKRWKDILVIKGVSAAEDAVLAADCGADGVIVSNHGGRSLDGCVPSMGALPEIVDAVGSRMTVMVDGGFKRGVDVLKAVAMGAHAVNFGRATIFGLAAGGEAGVSRAIEIFREEMFRGLAMMGAKRLDQLDRSMLEF